MDRPFIDWLAGRCRLLASPAIWRLRLANRRKKLDRPKLEFYWSETFCKSGRQKTDHSKKGRQRRSGLDWTNNADSDKRCEKVRSGRGDRSGGSDTTRQEP